MQRILALGALVLFTAIAGSALILDDRANQPNGCTMEAKICPDGTAVGRSGPNCEFAECPNGSVSEENNPEIVTARVGEPVSFGEINVTPLSVTDSRCAIGVTCVWAGKATVRLRVPTPQIGQLAVVGEKEIDIDVGEDIEIWRGVRLSLVSVDPYPQVNVTPDQSDYRITLKLTK